ncbi:MAG: M15 family metallopeptidase [Lentimicrobiaceae bacterium]|nr:M15 family metallopeptidase [Lentimicrobiaceae bacterium]
MKMVLRKKSSKDPRALSFLLLSLVLLFAVYSCYHHLTKENPYGLDIVSDIPSYHGQVALDSSNAMVNVATLIPGVVLDIRYATKNNFTHKRLYESPEAFVRKPVGEALVKIQKELNAKGLGLKIYDAYRPYGVTLKFYEVYPDTVFVAQPWKGSRHNRGCAVDVSLVDLRSGKELEMPTKFDDFTEKASQSYMALPAQVLLNKQTLKDVMVKYGFIPLQDEWWHYDFHGWEKFDLLDISFRELKKI